MSKNKTDIIDIMAQSADISKASAERAFDAVLQAITEELGRHGEVEFVGFGKFCTAHRDERKGRNPQTGAELTIPAMTVPQFKAGKKLKDAVNKKK